MTDLLCAAHMPESRSSEEQEKLHILSLTQLVIAELNGEHTAALINNINVTKYYYYFYYKMKIIMEVAFSHLAFSIFVTFQNFIQHKDKSYLQIKSSKCKCINCKRSFKRSVLYPGMLLDAF